MFERPQHELPLGTERGAKELRIEVLKTAQGLSTAIGLDRTRPVARALGRVASQAWTLNGGDADVAGGWDAFADAVFRWDAQVQDALVVQANQAAGYQLGRGLAETYWQLYPVRPADEMGSWASSLGSDRNRTLQRLALRLSVYIGPPVLAAVTPPLDAWVALAGSEQRRNADGVLTDLYRQGLRWRDLVRGERQPDDLNQPNAKDVWSDLSVYRSVVVTLRWPLAAGRRRGRRGSAGRRRRGPGQRVAGHRLEHSDQHPGRARAHQRQPLCTRQGQPHLDHRQRPPEGSAQAGAARRGPVPPDPEKAVAAARPWSRRQLVKLGSGLQRLGQS